MYFDSSDVAAVVAGTETNVNSVAVGE